MSARILFKVGLGLLGMALVAALWIWGRDSAIDYLLLATVWMGGLWTLFLLFKPSRHIFYAGMAFNFAILLVAGMNEMVRRYAAGGFSVELIQLCSLDGIPALLRFCGLAAVGALAAALVIAWGMTLAALWMARRTRKVPSRRELTAAAGLLLAGMAAILVGRLMPTAEVWEMVCGEVKSLSPEHMRRQGLTFPVPEREAVTAEPGMNLVHIFLESTELEFLDERLFPGLTPELNRLRRDGRCYRQVGAATNARLTFGGIFAAQCGYYLTPLHLRSGDHECDITAGRRLPTLPEVLHRAGYRQRFLYGHNASFPAFKSFLAQEHFEVIQLQAGGRNVRAGEIQYFSACRDGELMERAWVDFQALANGGRPFNLTILTLDGHAPDGICEPGERRYLGGAPTLLHAIFNTDRALGRLVDRIRFHPAGKRTVLVIQSDHPAHPYTEKSVMARLAQNPFRPLLFLIVGAPGLTGDNHRLGKTFDIAPTVLAALGVKHNAVFLLGENLERKCNPRRLDEGKEQMAALSAAVALYSEFDPGIERTGVAFQSDPFPSVRVGDLILPLIRRATMENGPPKSGELFRLTVARDRRRCWLDYAKPGEDFPARACGWSGWTLTLGYDKARHRFRVEHSYRKRLLGRRYAASLKELRWDGSEFLATGR